MQKEYRPTLESVQKAVATLKDVATETPLHKNEMYSEKYKASVFFKREDLQKVRSYKIRGAYNKIHSLPVQDRERGIVCASAGNHAQGVAFACKKLQIKGLIVMPSPTPKQKVEQVKMFGGQFVEIHLEGDTFDDAYQFAKQVCTSQKKMFIHPFNDPKIIEGQATVGLEVFNQLNHPIDFVFVPVGGGGLAAGLSSVFKQLSPQTKIIGVEPEGAASMKMALENGKVVKLNEIDKFIDGAAVQEVGDLTFNICKSHLDDMITVPEGKVCQTILELYNKEAIVVEPAGAMAISALEFYADRIKGKHVVCVVSGSNNDIVRTAEIKERALLYSQLKHYFIVQFPQRSGALKEFVIDVLGEKDDITFFEYSKKTSRVNGPAIVGIELESQEDLQPLINRMKALNFYGEYLNDKPNLFEFLI